MPLQGQKIGGLGDAKDEILGRFSESTTREDFAARIGKKGTVERGKGLSKD